MDHGERSAANRRLVRKLAIVATLMFGFGFALVPLYDVLCKVTGLNGKTGRVELEQSLTSRVDTDRLVTVEFLGTVNSDLPWEFRPLVRRVKVHPGEVTEVHYMARNKAGQAITGQAIPSLAPGVAAKYFNKTECFCFTQQTLKGEEQKEMPIRFVVDPDLPEDVRTVSLSYTFFKAQDSAPARAEAAEPGKLDSIL
jgi:cytochrome c oxidase assembly protein subunit 11